MALFTWKQEYETGFAEMDADHARVFALADRLHAAMGQGARREAIGPLLTALIEACRAHFRREEAFMIRTGYPELQGHKQEHQELIASGLVFARDVAESAGPLAADQLRFLKTWLSLHLQTQDRPMAAWMLERQVGEETAKTDHDC